MKQSNVLLISLMIAVAGGVFVTVGPYMGGKREIARAEADSRLRTKLALEAAEPERSKLAVVALSAQLLGELLDQWEGVTFTEPKTGVAITVAAIEPKFTAGFPRVVAKLKTEWRGRALILELEGVLKHELTDAGVRLEFQTLAVRAKSLSWHLRALTSPAFATWLNGVLPPIQIPLAQVADLIPRNLEIEDLWLNVPDGRVRLHFGLPALPALKIGSRAVAVFFDEDGLRMLARLSSNGPLTSANPITIPVGTAAPSVQAMQAITASWPGLPKGKSYFVHVPSQVVLDLLGAINQPSGAGISLIVQSNGSEGALMKMTGFKATLEQSNSFKAQTVVSSVSSTWEPASAGKSGGIRAVGRISANGEIHVHVNTIGIPAKVSGRGEAASSITLVVAYRANDQSFIVRVESPSQVRIKIDISGVPDILEKWFKAGVDIPVPVNKDLYRFKLPPVIRPTFEVSMPKGFTPEVKVISPVLDAPEVRFLADALEVSGTAHLPATPAAAAAAAVKQP